MDPWIFALLLVFGFGGVIISRYSNAPHLFTLFGGLCLLFSGLGLFVDGGLTLPQPLVNTTRSIEHSYSNSSNFTRAQYWCVNGSYYLTTANAYANGSIYCDPGNDMIRSYCEDRPLSNSTETQSQVVYYEQVWDYWIQAIALMLSLIGVAFIVSMAGGSKVKR